MGSTVQAGDQTKPLKDSVDSLSKSVAVCLAILYICGFLITSLSDFHYGFSEMNPFKPRILTAGAWFLLSLGIPFALTWELHKHPTWTSDLPWWSKAVRLVTIYYTSALLIFLTAGGVFSFDKQNPPPLPPVWKVVVDVICLFLVVMVFLLMLLICFSAQKILDTYDH